MHIAYSAIREADLQIINQTQAVANPQQALRLQAYQATCQKFNKEIAAIQKYLPGWVPARPAL
ncbi:hypothetical protein [Mucilaginibacter antarcticus]|uniref:Uncharacterized protein n=1 Tax=Mucilaginibacter antarcticus TaxID=1855725 RepID=A0ABW5XT70_9SPHI